MQLGLVPSICLRCFALFIMYLYIFPVGFKGNLSLLDSFSRGLNQMEGAFPASAFGLRGGLHDGRQVQTQSW